MKFITPKKESAVAVQCATLIKNESENFQNWNSGIPAVRCLELLGNFLSIISQKSTVKACCCRFIICHPMSGDGEEEDEQLISSKSNNNEDIRLTENNNNQQDVLYEDQKMKITRDGIILYCFWFPFAQQKFIPFENIKHHKLHPHISHFFMKSWGIAADFQVWWPMDFKKRLGERNAIILDLGGWPKIGFCPGYGKLEVVQKVYDIITAHCHEH